MKKVITLVFALVFLSAGPLYAARSVIVTENKGPKTFVQHIYDAFESNFQRKWEIEEDTPPRKLEGPGDAARDHKRFFNVGQRYPGEVM